MLFQPPPRFKVNCARLESFLRLLPDDVTAIFEFRDPSWYTDEILALLDRHGAGFCTHDMPGSESPRIAVGPVVYVRLYGGTGKYYGCYPDETLLGWTNWIVEQHKRGKAVWAYFNNDPEAHAIHDAWTSARNGAPGTALSRRSVAVGGEANGFAV